MIQSDIKHRMIWLIQANYTASCRLWRVHGFVTSRKYCCVQRKVFDPAEYSREDTRLKETVFFVCFSNRECKVTVLRVITKPTILMLFHIPVFVFFLTFNTPFSQQSKWLLLRKKCRNNQLFLIIENYLVIPASQVWSVWFFSLFHVTVNWTFLICLSL